MNNLKVCLNLILIQLIFITILIIALTALRFLDSNNFEVLKKLYCAYAAYDIDTSLVYDGEDN